MRSAAAGGLVAMAALVVACGGFRAEKIFSKQVEIDAVEVGRSLLCQSEGDVPTARLFAGPTAVRQWAQGRQIQLPEQLADAPHALVEVGRKSTGGYGVAVSRNAVRRGGLVILTGTFFSPSAGARVPQVQTSPCVVVQLPPGRYSAIEVNDQDGVIRAASEPDVPVGTKAETAGTKRKPATSVPHEEPGRPSTRTTQEPEDAKDAEDAGDVEEDDAYGGFGSSVVIEDEEPGFGE